MRRRRRKNKTKAQKTRQEVVDVVQLPDDLNALLGNLGTGRGELMEDVRLFAWDSVKNCSGIDCPAYNYCEHRETAEGGQCIIMGNYLAAVYSVVLNAVERNHNTNKEVVLLRIGFDLIPLYKNLIFLKLAEMGVTAAVEYDGKGQRRVNPVYKEIRDTVKEIERTWKLIDLGTFEGPPGGVGSGSGMGKFNSKSPPVMTPSKKRRNVHIPRREK